MRSEYTNNRDSVQIANEDQKDHELMREETEFIDE